MRVILTNSNIVFRKKLGEKLTPAMVPGYDGYYLDSPLHYASNANYEVVFVDLRNFLDKKIKVVMSADPSITTHASFMQSATTMQAPYKAAFNTEGGSSVDVTLTNDDAFPYLWISVKKSLLTSLKVIALVE